jgi:hypothetical protein
VRCGAGDDGLPGGGVILGAAGVVAVVGGGNCTEGTNVVAVPEGMLDAPGAPELFVPPLPHAATEATASATHAVNPILSIDRADMAFTAWLAGRVDGMHRGTRLSYLAASSLHARACCLRAERHQYRR